MDARDSKARNEACENRNGMTKLVRTARLYTKLYRKLRGGALACACLARDDQRCLTTERQMMLSIPADSKWSVDHDV